MPLGDHLHRSFQVTPDHLAAMRSALQSSSDSTLVTGAAIDALANRSTDTYIWHTRPNATHQESPLLRARMDESGIDPEARLAHGALGLIEALRVAYLQHPASPIRGFANVRYTAPVFEGARVTTTIQPDENGASGFEATTDQFEPGLAITGQILYGELRDDYDADNFSSVAEQQLFSLEEAIGLISATIGLGVQESGGRVLYMGQELVLRGLVALGDQLEVEADVTDRKPARREGERTTTDITVNARGAGPIASGESIFLYLNQPS